MTPSGSPARITRLRGPEASSAKLILTTVIANVIQLAATIMAVRAIGSAEYAVYGVLAGIAVVMGVVLTWRLDQFLLSRSVTRPREVFKIAILLTFAGACLLVGLMLAFPVITWAFDIPSESRLVGLVGALSALTALQALTTSVAIREQDYRLLNISRVLKALMLVLAVGTILRSIPSAAGFLLATAVATLAPLTIFRWRVSERPVGCDGEQWTNVRSFVAYNLPTAIITAFNQQLPVFAFFLAYEPETAGEISLAYKLILLPLFVAGAALGQLVTLAYHGAKDIDNFRPQYVRIVRRLSALSLAIVLIVAVLPWRDILAGVLPDQSEIATYIVLFAPILVLFTLSSPLSGVIVLEGKVRLAFWISIAEGVLRIGALVMATAASASPEVGILAFVAVSSVIAINYLVVTSRHVLGGRALRAGAIAAPVILVTVSSLALAMTAVLPGLQWMVVCFASLGLFVLMRVRGKSYEA